MSNRYIEAAHIANEGKVFELKRAGGWKSLQAMQPYLKLNENDIQQAISEHSPVDSLGKES